MGERGDDARAVPGAPVPPPRFRMLATTQVRCSASGTRLSSHSTLPGLLQVGVLEEEVEALMEDVEELVSAPALPNSPARVEAMLHA